MIKSQPVSWLIFSIYFAHDCLSWVDDINLKYIPLNFKNDNGDDKVES